MLARSPGGGGSISSTGPLPTGQGSSSANAATQSQNGVLGQTNPGNSIGNSLGPLPTDIVVIPLVGGYAVKLTDLLFILGGIGIGLVIGGDLGAVILILGILAGVTGVLWGWD